MKKFLSLILIFALLMSLMVTSAMAAGDGIASVTSATGAPGETVTVTVSLKNFAKANTVGIRVTADEGLVLNTKDSKWLLPGDAADIDSKNNGVWMYLDDGTVEINGNIVSLVFTVPTPAVGQKNFVYHFSCEVTASNDGQNTEKSTAKGTVTVVNPVTDLALDKETLALDLNGGATGTLVATMTPANASEVVTWTSSDTTVATVDGGVVTGLKLGQATITAAAGSLTKTCLVTVSCSHDLEETAAVAPNCQHGGNNQYFTCKVCEKIFKADKTTETTVEAEQLPIGDHTGGTATCTEKAVCDTCGQPYGNLLPHDYDETTELCKVCGHEKPAGILGDADGNGKVLANDAMLVLQYSVGAITADKLNVVVCDVDGSGKILANDAMMILQYSVGAITVFPVEQ